MLEFFLSGNVEYVMMYPIKGVEKWRSLWWSIVNGMDGYNIIFEVCALL